MVVKGTAMKKASALGEYYNDMRKHSGVYLLAIPVFLFYVVFHYMPMYGLVIAFKEFSPRLGIMRSAWVGLSNFISFFQSYYFVTLLRNTLLISVYNILWGFPAPIVLALLLNEIRNRHFKRITQTLTYLPHFISLVVICGIIIDFCSSNGVVNDIIVFFGGERSNLLMQPRLFRTIFISTNIWQYMGWNSIIYLAALSNIDQQLYEAAEIDGAGRWSQTIHITIPSIIPTIIILLILRIGRVMSVGFEKIILLYNPMTYEVADVISSFVYRRGLLDADYSYSAAVGLFNSIINFALLVMTNKFSRKFSATSLW